jgi:hypothetical protein
MLARRHLRGLHNSLVGVWQHQESYLHQYPADWQVVLRCGIHAKAWSIPAVLVCTSPTHVSHGPLSPLLGHTACRAHRFQSGPPAEDAQPTGSAAASNGALPLTTNGQPATEKKESADTPRAGIAFCSARGYQARGRRRSARAASSASKQTVKLASRQSWEGCQVPAGQLTV